MTATLPSDALSLLCHSRTLNEDGISHRITADQDGHGFLVDWDTSSSLHVPGLNTAGRLIRGQGRIGTWPSMSVPLVQALDGYVQSRRDDLESSVHTLFYLVLRYTQVPGWDKVDLLQRMRDVFGYAVAGTSSGGFKECYLTHITFTNAELEAHVKPEVLSELMMEVRRPFHHVYAAPAPRGTRRKMPDLDSDSDVEAEAAKTEARRTKYTAKLTRSSKLLLKCFKYYLQEGDRWPEDDQAKNNFSL
ncbi:hypothetical protein PENSPDRAFT_658742 [Peniophora sp. CONT]|nr:hypothetical protein PENSPDRAFT_658742 [Peniophora sp. CONT]